MRGEPDPYRDAFRLMAEQVLAAEPARFGMVTPTGLVAVAVGEFLVAANALMAQLDPMTSANEAT
ncbi:MAG: hypothetical protein GEU90_16205 [Gemmatimonas sp.]|nr:hypothetical protein [Gemmatimonas sp.]